MRCRVGIVVVVEAAKMQQAMNDVKRQLVAGLDAEFSRPVAGHLGRDDQFAGQNRLVGVRQREA